MVLGLLVHVTPLIFFSRILRREALVYTSFFFRRAALRKLFDIRFAYKHTLYRNFARICLLVKMASETLTRSIASNALKFSYRKSLHNKSRCSNTMKSFLAFRIMNTRIFLYLQKDFTLKLW